jgi:GNAT superfamily N-acetyltransferase
MWLEDLFVSEKYRGQGTGRALLEYLAKIAVERRYARMEWTVLNWNTRAQDFYRSLGAAPLEDWRVWRLNDSDLSLARRGSASSS